MTTYKITIPLEPRTKKNGARIYGRRLLPSKAFEQYEAECMQYLRPCPVKQPIDYPVNIKALYYVPLFKNGNRKRIDKTNLESALMDILVEYKILADDDSTIVVTTDGSRVIHIKGQGKTEITITELSE